MTLFRPATGEVRAKGVISVTNAVLHPWLKEQLLAALEAEANAWETWVGWPLSDRYPKLAHASGVG